MLNYFMTGIIKYNEDSVKYQSGVKLGVQNMTILSLQVDPLHLSKICQSHLSPSVQIYISCMPAETRSTVMKLH